MKKAIAFLMILMLLTTINLQGRNTAATAPAASEAATAPAAAEEAPIVYEPAAPAKYAFAFTAATLDGDTVTEEVFGRYDLTMVNLWASWCGSCRSELAELGQLYAKLPENVGFFSVTVDDPDGLEDAKALLEQNGCAFPCLDGLGSQGLVRNVINRVMAIPTTLFFDRSGNQVGEMLVGVPQSAGSVAEAYLSEIQARLDLLHGK